MVETKNPVKMDNKRGKDGRFLPGSCGNPHGRPRNEFSITNICREMLSQPCPFDPEKRTWAQYLAYRLLSQSVDNITSLKELLERLEGKITIPIDSESEIKITYTIGKGYTSDEKSQ